MEDKAISFFLQLDVLSKVFKERDEKVQGAERRAELAWWNLRALAGEEKPCRSRSSETCATSGSSKCAWSPGHGELWEPACEADVAVAEETWAKLKADLEAAPSPLTVEWTARASQVDFAVHLANMLTLVRLDHRSQIGTQREIAEAEGAFARRMRRFGPPSQALFFYGLLGLRKLEQPDPFSVFRLAQIVEAPASFALRMQAVREHQKLAARVKGKYGRWETLLLLGSSDGVDWELGSAAAEDPLSFGLYRSYMQTAKSYIREGKWSKAGLEDMDSGSTFKIGEQLSVALANDLAALEDPEARQHWYEFVLNGLQARWIDITEPDLSVTETWRRIVDAVGAGADVEQKASFAAVFELMNLKAAPTPAQLTQIERNVQEHFGPVNLVSQRLRTLAKSKELKDAFPEFVQGHRQLAKAMRGLAAHRMVVNSRYHLPAAGYYGLVSAWAVMATELLGRNINLFVDAMAAVA